MFVKVFLELQAHLLEVCQYFQAETVSDFAHRSYISLNDMESSLVCFFLDASELLARQSYRTCSFLLKLGLCIKIYCGFV